MRLGPLRFLACVACATMAWAVSRVSVVIDGARADVAAAAWRAGLMAAAMRTPVPLPRRGRRFDASADQIALPGPSSVGPPSSIVWEVLSHAPERADQTPRTFAASAVPLPPPPIAPVPTVIAPAPIQPALMLARRQSSSSAYQRATTAYAALSRRDRRAAAQGFADALAAAPDAPNAATWRAELSRLRQRWSGDAFILVRGAGPVGLGVAPLLGGGQSGGSIAFTPDPLARRPLAVVARLAVAHLGEGFGIAGIDRASLQTALGVRWQVVPGASLTAERLIAGGASARDAWVVRAAGGAAGKVGPVLLDAYAEAGVVGAGRRDTFASAQARATVALPAGVDAGAGAWASVQDAATTVHRVDVGPTIGWRHGAVSARADWRFRVSGDAAPESGPALTVAAAF